MSLSGSFVCGVYVKTNKNEPCQKWNANIWFISNQKRIRVTQFICVCLSVFVCDWTGIKWAQIVASYMNYICLVRMIVISVRDTQTPTNENEGKTTTTTLTEMRKITFKSLEWFRNWRTNGKFAPQLDLLVFSVWLAHWHLACK